MNQQRNCSATLQKTLFLAVCSLPAICALYMICTHWVPVPFWDQWDTPGAQLASYYRGTLTFAELCSQHNEHRVLFPRLIWLPMAIVTGWDVRREMVACGLVCLGCSFGIYKLLRRSLDGGGLLRSSNASPAGCALVFGMMNLLLFSPRQYETFLVGAGHSFVPTFALVFALLMNLSERSLPTKTIVNAALAHIGTWSYGNGMLVWLLAFPLEIQLNAGLPANRTRARIFWKVIYILVAAASIASYFISYKHPPLSPPMVSPIGHWSAFLRFLLVWVGSLFSVSAPAICGGVLLLLFAGLATAATCQMRQTGAWRSHYPWLLLGCYVVISGGIAAIARLGFSSSMAGDARYTAFSVFLYIAVLGLGFSVSAHAQNRATLARAARPAAMVCLALVLLLWAITFKNERRRLRDWTQERKHSLLVVQWAEAIPRNPEIALLSPYAETPNVIHTLAEHDVFRPRLVSKNLARVVNESPVRESASAGILEQATRDGAGHIIVRGWARLPDQDRPADCVVLGFEAADVPWTPFSVLETRSPANDRFLRIIDVRSLPRSEATLRAWAIDLQHERAFPMAGALQLPGQQ